MSLIPRRHRSLVYKLLVIIPVVWITVALVMYNDKSSDDLGQIRGGPRAEAQRALNLIDTGGGSDTGSRIEDEEVTTKRSTKDPNDRWKGDPDRHAEGVVPPPRDPSGPGENGQPFKIENPDKETKKMIDKGWQDNAFNQYVSDKISVHRSLPDARDEW